MNRYYFAFHKGYVGFGSIYLYKHCAVCIYPDVYELNVAVENVLNYDFNCRVRFFNMENSMSIVSVVSFVTAVRDIDCVVADRQVFDCKCCQIIDKSFVFKYY